MVFSFRLCGYFQKDTLTYCFLSVMKLQKVWYTYWSRSESPRPQAGASITTSVASGFSLLSDDTQCSSWLFLLLPDLLMFAQSIRLAKIAHPITPVSLQDALEILDLLRCSLASRLHLISTSAVEMTQTDAHDLLRFLAYLSRSHDSLLSRGIVLPLSFGCLPLVSTFDTLAPIPNGISFHILYDWSA